MRTIEVDTKDLLGQAFYPLNCSFTYLVETKHPAPWYITHVKMTRGYCGDDDHIRVWIRGEESCWYSLARCFVSDYEELKEHVQYQAEQERIDKAISVQTTII